MAEIQKIKDVLRVLTEFKSRSDGTYDFNTMVLVEYINGYQVSFVRPEAFEQLSSEQWDKITNYYIDYFNSDANIGVYDGGAEVSFHCREKQKSIEVMEKYNQESVLDWEKKTKEPDNIPSWFIINRLFNKELILDYDKIIKEIL